MRARRSSTAAPPWAQRQRARLFWMLLPDARLSHFQVDLPPSISKRAVGNYGFRLADVSLTGARKPSLFPLPHDHGPGRGRVANAVAPRVRRKRSTMERAVALSSRLLVTVTVPDVSIRKCWAGQPAARHGRAAGSRLWA